jgi:hypothetical protein
MKNPLAESQRETKRDDNGTWILAPGTQSIACIQLVPASPQRTNFCFVKAVAVSWGRILIEFGSSPVLVWSLGGLTGLLET